jgi:hypothetical protein
MGCASWSAHLRRKRARGSCLEVRTGALSGERVMRCSVANVPFHVNSLVRQSPDARRFVLPGQRPHPSGLARVACGQHGSLLAPDQSEALRNGVVS